jgi:catechol 2,3-dioxygenase-like lactoylglutathione lyase family enzyme
MERPQLAGIHHVKIPVTDLHSAREWYERVFGFEVTMEFPDDDGVVRGVAGTMPGLGATMVGLREHPVAAAGCVGFDPVGFAVDEASDLEAWIEHLDRHGIDHSPLIEASIGWLLVFHGPDGLELHLYTWAGHGEDHSDRPGYGRQVAS